MSGEEKSTELSVIIPTYNEAENIPVLLRRLKRALESSSVGDKYEVIIVDDSSPDGTAKVAEETARKESIEDKVRVIVRPGRLGLSTAVLEGVKLARGKYLVVMDADLQHPPEKVPEIYSRLVDGADLVIGSRRNRL
ncbi:MAG: glycosyltransferase, partial [Fervidicoccaceae archaeon]